MSPVVGDVPYGGIAEGGAFMSIEMLRCGRAAGRLPCEVKAGLPWK
jgi:hypothetical protein